MAVAFQSIQTNSATSNADVVVTKPASLAAGDLMVGYIAGYCNSGASIDLLSGWTAIVASQTLNTGAFRAMYKVADAGDVAASNFTFHMSGTTPNFLVGAIYRITGQGNATLIDASNTATLNNSASPSIAATITPARGNDLLLMLGIALGTGVQSAGFGSQAIVTSNPSWTEDFDIGETNAIGTFAAHASRPETTATGNTSFTNNGDANTDSGVIMVAIAPTLDVTISPSAVTGSGTVNAPTMTGGATVSPSAITGSGTVNTPTDMGQADWSAQGKSTAPTWTATSKS